MRIKFKGILAAATANEVIQGKIGAINKCTIFVAPIKFDESEGTPTFGTFDQSFPVECFGDNAVAMVANIPQGQQVHIIAELRGRSSYDQSNQRLKGFLSLSLVSCSMDGQQPQPVQQPTAQAAAQPAPMPTAQPAPAPFPFPGSK